MSGIGQMGRVIILTAVVASSVYGGYALFVRKTPQVQQIDATSPIVPELATLEGQIAATREGVSSWITSQTGNLLQRTGVVPPVEQTAAQLAESGENTTDNGGKVGRESGVTDTGNKSGNAIAANAVTSDSGKILGAQTQQSALGNALSELQQNVPAASSPHPDGVIQSIKEMPQQAATYMRYLYCRQVVEDWDKEKAKTASPTPAVNAVRDTPHN